MLIQYLFTLRISFKSIISICSCLILVCSCQPKRDSLPAASDHKIVTGQSNIKHAIGFDLVDYETFKVLNIIRHYNETSDTLSYMLYEEGADIHENFSDLYQIQIPIQNIALLHSSYLSFFELCEAKDHIKAISEAKYIYDESVYSSVQNGELIEVGYGETLDKERLLELNISAVVTVGFPNTPNKSQQMLDELGIPVLVFSDWQETGLLGRAEWVKVVAALTGSEKLVNEKFELIEKEYKKLTSLTKDLDNPPKIICNLPYKGSWYVPGGNSYVSNLLHDAGSDYLWASDDGTGGIQMDFETVYAKGIEADFWINPDFAKTLQDIIDTDERLIDFKPISTRSVYNSNFRMSRGIANDFWESGIVNPHLILADLIKILHPELLPDHQLFYYKQIN
ncbi:MAG: ABC transporter substrate-binding protein [Cyclobacteriaceae bacterium]|nr:ABC transporter substrate-binding protein [Cyclobacteriaceae bacterium]